MSATSPVLIITDSGGCGNDLDVDGQSVVFGTARLRTVTSSAACDCYLHMCLLIACCVREREIYFQLRWLLMYRIQTVI